MTGTIQRRDRNDILSALRTGMVPRRALHHLQVGRAAEVAALTSDIRAISEGGTAMRVITGEYGSGKSFFLQVIRTAAQRANCVTLHADVTQDARLYGTHGRVRALYTNLVNSAGTKTQPEGGAMAVVLEQFINQANDAARESRADVEHVIRDRLRDLAAYRSGYEFTDVVLAYYEGWRRNDDQRRQAALRWLAGEYATVSAAKAGVGVSAAIGDQDLFPMLRLLSMLVRRAGYRGLVIQLDELSVLARLPRNVREQNYEQILTMVNGLTAANTEHLMIMFAGTSEFVTDPVKGMHSYGALRQRLSPNQYVQDGLTDTKSPQLTLRPFSYEDLWVLLENVHRVYCSNNQKDPLPNLKLVVQSFLQQAEGQLGGLARITAREATRSWLHLLDILDQNPQADWQELLGGVTVSTDDAPAPEPIADEEAATDPHRDGGPLADLKL